VLLLLLNSECQAKMAAPAQGLFPSLFHSSHCVDDSVSSFFQMLHSPGQQGGNTARRNFHKFLCTKKTEAPGDKAEGKSAEFLGIKSGDNPQSRKMPLPPRAQCTVLATEET